MNKHKSLLAGLAFIALGAMAGWGASKMSDRNATPPAGPLPMAFDVMEKPNGSITPQQTYQTPKMSRATTPRRPAVRSGLTLPAGEAVHVVVNEALSSKTAVVGQSWSGEVVQPVIVGSRVLIPEGSRVSGTVVSANPARRGDRARLQLAMTSITANGRTYRVRGSSEALVAGSPRKRNVGAIAGSAAAGALIGRAVGGSTKSTVIGAAVGAGAATAAVAASSGYQVNIPAGKQMVFYTSNSVAVRA